VGELFAANNIAAYTYVHVHIRTYIYTYKHTTYIHTLKHTYLRVGVDELLATNNIAAYTYVYVHIRTYIHTYIHTYIETYTPAYRGGWAPRHDQYRVAPLHKWRRPPRRACSHTHRSWLLHLVCGRVTRVIHATRVIHVVRDFVRNGAALLDAHAHVQIVGNPCTWSVT